VAQNGLAAPGCRSRHQRRLEPLSRALCVNLNLNYLQIIKITIITLEATISVLFLAGALWSISGLWTCPKGTPDCEGWAILGAYILAPGGFLFGVASIILAKTKAWYSQVALLLGLVWILYWGFYA
jgi:hypothetical protein